MKRRPKKKLRELQRKRLNDRQRRIVKDKRRKQQRLQPQINLLHHLLQRNQKNQRKLPNKRNKKSNLEEMRKVLVQVLSVELEA
jgi:hypothetical protein